MTNPKTFSNGGEEAQTGFLLELDWFRLVNTLTFILDPSSINWWNQMERSTTNHTPSSRNPIEEKKKGIYEQTSQDHEGEIHKDSLTKLFENWEL